MTTAELMNWLYLIVGSGVCLMFISAYCTYKKDTKEKKYDYDTEELNKTIAEEYESRMPNRSTTDQLIQQSRGMDILRKLYGLEINTTNYLERHEIGKIIKEVRLLDDRLYEKRHYDKEYDELEGNIRYLASKAEQIANAN